MKVCYVISEYIRKFRLVRRKNPKHYNKTKSASIFQLKLCLRKYILSSDWGWGWEQKLEWGFESEMGNGKVPPVPGDDSIISQATHPPHNLKECSDKKVPLVVGLS